MGRYFDFEPVKPWAGGYGKELAAIGDALVSNREEALKRRKTEADIAHEQANTEAYGRQVDAQVAGIDRKQTQDDITFGQQQQDRREKRTEKYAGLLGGDRVTEAQALAGASRFYNPRTKQMEGDTLTQDPVGPAPTMPERPNIPEPQAPAFVGPLETPEGARARAMSDALRGNAPRLAGKTKVAGDYPGMVRPGNIDLTNRPDVANPDGSHSSVRSMSFNSGGREVLVPTVSEDGRIMSDNEAMGQFRHTGRSLGQFRAPADAPRYAQALHEQQAAEGRTRTPPAPGSGEELLAQTAGAAAQGDVERQTADRQGYVDALKNRQTTMRDYDARSAGYQAEKKTYDERAAHPTFTLGFASGEKQQLDPQEAKRAKIADAQETADNLRQQAARPDTTPELRAQMLAQAAGVQARVDSSGRSAINNAALASSAHGATALQKRLDRETNLRINRGHDVARVEAAKARGAGGLYPNADQGRVNDEYRRNFGDITQKNGLRDQLEGSEGAISAIRDDPSNPTVWTNGIDGMIRTTTGKAAIIQQYKLYTGKSAGAEDAAAQFKAWVDGDQLSDQQKANLFGAMLDGHKEVVDRWNRDMSVSDEYDTDPRVTASPAVGLSVARTKHAIFRGGKRQPMADTTVPGSPGVKLPGKRGAPPPAVAPAPAAGAPAANGVPPMLEKPAADHASGSEQHVGGKKLVKLGPNHWDWAP